MTWKGEGVNSPDDMMTRGGGGSRIGPKVMMSLMDVNYPVQQGVDEASFGWLYWLV